MLTLHHASKTFRDDLAAFCRSATVPREISDAVAAILADVRARGDEAVSYYAAKFDGAKLRARDFRVPAADLAGAAKKITPAELRAFTNRSSPTTNAACPRTGARKTSTARSSARSSIPSSGWASTCRAARCRSSPRC
jgi:histidinol dehydrogenase